MKAKTIHDAISGDIDNRIRLCPHCYHEQDQDKGRECEWCGGATMVCNHQMALALKINAGHEERMRHAEPLPHLRTHQPV